MRLSKPGFPLQNANTWAHISCIRALTQWNCVNLYDSRSVLRGLYILCFLNGKIIATIPCLLGWMWGGGIVIQHFRSRNKLFLMCFPSHGLLGTAYLVLWVFTLPSSRPISPISPGMLPYGINKMEPSWTARTFCKMGNLVCFASNKNLWYVIWYKNYCIAQKTHGIINLSQVEAARFSVPHGLSLVKKKLKFDIGQKLIVFEFPSKITISRGFCAI